MLEDHTYARKINTIRGDAIDMALDKEGYQAFEDPEYTKKILDIIKGDSDISILNMKDGQEFVNSECVEEILGMAESNTSHNRKARNSRNQHPNNIPYNRRVRNGRSGNHSYNLRSGGKKSNTR